VKKLLWLIVEVCTSIIQVGAFAMETRSNNVLVE
jgi:hypothetical protein